MIYEKKLKSHAEYITEYLKDQEYDEKNHIKDIANKKLLELKEDARQSYMDKRSQNNLREQEFIKFGEDIKKVFLSECIMDIFTKVLQSPVMEANTLVIARNLVNKFINENGVDNLLREFKTKSILLSEYNRLTNGYYKKTIKDCDKDNKDTYLLDPKIKDDFFDELKMTDPEYAIGIIKDRVSDGIQEFIDGNIANKIDIKDILQSVKDKIDTAKIDGVEESYGLFAKRAIHNIKDKPKNVFWTMTQYMCESVMKNNELKNYYLKDNKLDIDRIIEDCKVMYTFLELLNSTKMANINEQYIENILSDIRG